MIEWALVGVFKVHLYLSNLFISLALTKLAFKWFDLETNERNYFSEEKKIDFFGETEEIRIRKIPNHNEAGGC